MLSQDLNITFVALGVFGCLIVYYLYAVFSSPLQKVPGPWYASFTNLVLKKHTVAGRRVHYIHKLHEKYGPVVRLAPTEIDVAEPQAYKQVHKIGSGFLKDPWYQSFRFAENGTHDVFSMIDPKEHSERRKLFAPLWTNSALHQHWEAMVTDKVRLTVSKIKRDASMKEADVFKWWTFMTTDVISTLAFGESLNMLEAETRNQYMLDVEIATKVGGVLAEFQFLKPIVAAIKLLPLPIVDKLLGAEARIQEYGRVSVTNAKSRDLSKENVFSRVLAQWDGEKKQASGPGLSEFEVAFEAGGFIVAGSGTTAVSLTYLVWAVLKHPNVQRRLEEEVAELPSNYNDAQLEHLPFLNAVIEETLRLYGAAPGSLPRRPPNGGVTLHGGYFVPEGTTVSSQAFSLHRNEDIYPNALSYTPERFIDQNNIFVPMKESYAPFGAGSRTCLGVHLAKMELRHGAAEFFRECKGARLSASMTPEVMDIQNYFLISPRGDRCCVTLS